MFIGAYRFEHNRSWTPIEDVPQKDSEMQGINDLMSYGGLPSLECMTQIKKNEKVD